MNSLAATTPAQSDEALLLAIGRGDELAFEAFYDRHSPLLFGLTCQILGNKTEAEDVLQEGFLYLWKKAGDYDEARGKARNWAIMIVRNKAIDRLRTRARQHKLAEQAAVELPDLLETQPGRADDEASANEESRRVQRAVQALPAEQRRLIEWAFLKGWTHHVIADFTGLPLGTVKTNIRRGLSRLRDMLKGNAG
jgi:RNA polymerase sigma-70 factor (ECF subfamily)